MHQRTLTIFLACGVFAAVLFFLWVLADGKSAPAVSVINSAKTVSYVAPAVIHTVTPEVMEPAIDYTAILARFKGKDVEKVPVAKKLFALTFDGGASAEGVEEILQTLSDHTIRATFFLTGRFMEKFPDSVARIMQSGGEIANHTVTHKDLSVLSNEAVIEEINGMQKIAQKQGVAVAPFFRFPYGAPTKGTIALANDLGYVAVRWTVDSLGWQGKKDGRDASFVQKRVVEKVAPGGIALMHLGSAKDGSTFDADVLPEIITALTEQGYQLVPLSELFHEAIKNTALR